MRWMPFKNRPRGLKRARKLEADIILICSITIWFMLSFSVNFRYGVDIENSILAMIGKTISWVFYPMIGANSWKTAVSAIQGLIAKEQVISSMSVMQYKYSVIFNVLPAKF